MKRTKRNILYHELIGLRVSILKSLDPSLEGVRGTVYWETSRTLWIKVGSKVVKALKRGSIFAFELPGGSVAEVKGDKLLGRPEERVAARWPRGAGA
ncbi:ribonuclease P protein component 1 [Stetteria hydrogenophila]